MVAFKLEQFGGMIPRLDPDVLPEKMSAEAVDCDLRSGTLDGLPQRLFQIAFPGSRRAYKFPELIPGEDGQQFVWFGLPSEFSQVVRSPIANDLLNRVYWTNPGDPAGPWWTTFQRVKDGIGPYQLGITQPPDGYALAVTVTGGTVDGTLPFDARVYVFTYINEFGEESAPCSPSGVAEGPNDGTWTVIGMPAIRPPNPDDKPDFPIVKRVTLYRTVVGNNGSVDYYAVNVFKYDDDDVPGTYPVPDVYVDPFTDLEVVGNYTLATQTWGNPPYALDGLVALPNGMMVGFTNNTLHFCEPYHPHAWPKIYDKSVLYDMSAMTVWQGQLMVLTVGYPSVGTGNSPANFLLTQIQAAEPCVARGSVVTNLQGVYYASQNGLVLMNNSGLVNTTYASMTKNIWLNNYNAETLIACRHRSQYMAIDQKTTGFLYDSQESNLGFIRLSDQVFDIISLWNDEYDGNAYMMASDGNIYMWDNDDTSIMPYRWRSKTYSVPKGVSLGAAHIVTVPENLSLPPLHDPALTLPEGVLAEFRLYAGDELPLVMTRRLFKTNDVFRLVSGFMAFDWQIELVSRVRIKSVELASTMKELQGV